MRILRTHESDVVPLDDTLDSSLPEGSVSAGDRCQRIELVRGSGPHITAETTSLLRVRLRAAAVALWPARRSFSCAVWRAAMSTATRWPNRPLFNGFRVVLAVLGIW